MPNESLQSSWGELAKQVVHERNSTSGTAAKTRQSDGNSTSFYANLLKSCSRQEDLSQARDVHARILGSKHHRDVYLLNLVVEMYGKCGSLRDARSVFDSIEQPNVFSWNIVVAAYARNGELQEARKLFDKMPVRDVVSWNAMVAMYAQNGLLEEAGKMFHKMPKRDLISWNAVIAGYAQNGHVEQARRLLFSTPQRDVVSWTTVITAYSQTGQSKEAVVLFRKMDLEGIQPDKVTFTSILDACASHATLADGKAIHASILESGLVIDTLVGTGLVNMYGKCGRLEEARRIFDEIRSRGDVVLWTAMVAAYAQCGHGEEAIEAFHSMHLEGVEPDDVLFIGLLCACNHAGLLHNGWQYFISMNPDFGICASSHHYACMVDLLGRAGWLDDAEELLKVMPFEPDAASWTALLGACRTHRDEKRAVRAGERVFELDPDNSAPYALLIDIHATAKHRINVAKINRVRKERGVKKLPGCSCIVVKDKQHEFTVGDVGHPRTKEIYAELQRLKEPMKAHGYIPDTTVVVHEVEEEKKESMVYCHSEKLAVAFGLIATPPGTSLRIVKNLRVCSDCHSALKCISRITGREILVRDPMRFHLFEHGVCSCGDYW